MVALQFFGGHPESNFHLLAATVVFFALRLVVLRREGALPGVRRPVAAFVLGVLGGTALAAVTLIPFLELLARSSDVDVRQGFSGIALPKKYLLGFALYDYWGRATHTAAEAFAQERALYFGALPLTLAADRADRAAQAPARRPGRVRAVPAGRRAGRLAGAGDRGHIPVDQGPATTCAWCSS